MTTNITTIKTANTGRLATFTFPAMSFNDLLALSDKFGLREPPLPTASQVMAQAAEDIALGVKGAVRWFTRALRGRVVEVIEEHLITHAGDGYVKGQRTVIARLAVSGGSIRITEMSARFAEMIEEGAIGAAFHHHCYFMLPRDVGQWAADVVQLDMGGLPQANRGHSFHVLAKSADWFDAWLRDMITATGLPDRDVQVVSFCVVDDDPVTLASLVRAARARLSEAMERATQEVTKATTQRGIEGAVARLRMVVRDLDAYAGLFGAEMDALRSTAEDAALNLMGAQTAANLGVEALSVDLSAASAV